MRGQRPSAAPNVIWYVTNDLLPIELITGKPQVGFTDTRSARQPRLRRAAILANS
jgi:hypothetical protein